MRWFALLEDWFVRAFDLEIATKIVKLLFLPAFSILSTEK